MTGAKNPPTDGAADIIARAAADLRDTTAGLADTAARLDTLFTLVADTVAAATVLMGQIGQYQRAQRLLLDVHAAIPTAAPNGAGKETADVPTA